MLDTLIYVFKTAAPTQGDAKVTQRTPSLQVQTSADRKPRLPPTPRRAAQPRASQNAKANTHIWCASCDSPMACSTAQLKPRITTTAPYCYETMPRGGNPPANQGGEVIAKAPRTTTPERPSQRDSPGSASDAISTQHRHCPHDTKHNWNLHRPGVPVTYQYTKVCDRAPHRAEHEGPLPAISSTKQGGEPSPGERTETTLPQQTERHARNTEGNTSAKAGGGERLRRYRAILSAATTHASRVRYSPVATPYQCPEAETKRPPRRMWSRTPLALQTRSWAYALGSCDRAQAITTPKIPHPTPGQRPPPQPNTTNGTDRPLLQS